MPYPILHRPRVVACLGLALVGLGSAAPAAGLRAQQSERTAIISGRVVDATTGRPLPGAAVAFGKKGPQTLTDSAGRFALRVAPGSYPLHISQLGYRDEWRAISVAAEARGATLAIRLAPDPVLLDGLTAIADRFRARRNAVATSVRAFDRQDMRATGAQNMAQFLEEDAFLHRAPCQGGTFPDPFLDCALVRGQVRRVQVYIDDILALGGLNELAMYRPAEIYLVEVYAGGAQVRAYTNWWVEYSARHHIKLQPILEGH